MVEQKTVHVGFRLPCAVHASCDETGVHLVHGRSFGSLSVDELNKTHEGKMGCDFCEGDLDKIKNSLLNKGSWTCKCGATHALDSNRKVSPVMAVVW